VIDFTTRCLRDGGWEEEEEEEEEEESRGEGVRGWNDDDDDDDHDNDRHRTTHHGGGTSTTTCHGSKLCFELHDRVVRATIHHHSSLHPLQVHQIGFEWWWWSDGSRGGVILWVETSEEAPCWYTYR